MKTIAIIGGGITGLSIAHRLQRERNSGVRYLLLESGNRLGGKIVSVAEQGCTLEGGPDSFLSHRPALRRLCGELGLDSQLIQPETGASTLYLWQGKKLKPLPEGITQLVPRKISPFLRSSVISWPGKMRMGMEYFIPPKRDEGDESLASFVERRLGGEMLRTIAGPLLAGIHGGDAAQLSVLSTFPQLRRMEREHGGLLRAMLANRRQTAAAAPSGNTGGGFYSFKNGMQQLIDALAAQLDPTKVKLGQRISRLWRGSQGWVVQMECGSGISVDEVVLAVPAYSAATLVATLDPELRDEFNAIPYASSATVSVAFRRADLLNSAQGLGKGWGYFVPPKAHRRLKACTWTSAKFPARSPEDVFLLRAFLGGPELNHILQGSDNELEDIVRQELRITLGIRATPLFTRIFRWERGNPQYVVGHTARIARIDQLLSRHEGLYFAGAGRTGGGVPGCVEQGERLAAAFLEERTQAVSR